MDKTRKEEGTTAVVRDRDHEHEQPVATADDEPQPTNTNKALVLEDRMKGIAAELLEMEKEETKGTKKKKKKVQKVEPYGRFPTSDKEPTREHLLIREHHDAATKWEKSMRAKYMEGQVVEMMSKIMEHVNAKTQFPPTSSSQFLYHNWTQELMDHARTGWHKYKTFFETLDKYPMQNMEQIYRADTEEWILLDRSGKQPKKKRKKNK